MAGPSVRRAAQTALDGTDDNVADFLAEGQHAARAQDDRIRVTQIMSGGGPATKEAAQTALSGDAADAREFLIFGQHVARARDEELFTIAQLASLAKEAGELAAEETQLAKVASAQAVEAARQAKLAAQRAAAETAAAKDSANRAAAAAGRAADAAAGAAEAARTAIGAANQASNAARAAAIAASRAASAATRAGQAAAQAYGAAAAAARDKKNAGAARDAAVNARNIAAGARRAAEASKQAGLAAQAASGAATAAASAGNNAAAAAEAAAEAGGYAHAAGAEATRARNAAATARNAARRATRAANAAERLAGQAAKAADDAYKAANAAATHAEAAAVAADDAAAHAGEAQEAAARSTRHAAAALTAANTATEAANTASEVEETARAAEAERLTIQTEQDVETAEELRVADLARGTQPSWDTPELSRQDAETQQLLAAARAPGASPATVLGKGRQAAARLMKVAGSWTRAAAETALAGGEVEVREFLTTGLAQAAEQDDRVRVQHLFETGKPALQTAANAALAGTHGDILQFLQTRQYVGKEQDDRVAIAQVMSNAGPATKAAAQRALDGSDADRHTFLTVDQHVTRAQDDRVRVSQIMAGGGPEVKAAAQVALAGPTTFARHFIAVTQFKAARRDLEGATHVARVRGYIAVAAEFAANARKDAAEAARVAADARDAAAEAAAFAKQAKAAADQAAGYAAQAKQSSQQAKASADQAAQSAKTARTAAAAARQSAAAAESSASRARYSATGARRYSAWAQASATRARASALEAGKSAAEAAHAADAAFKIAVARQLKEAEEKRKTGSERCLPVYYDPACVDDQNAFNKIIAGDTTASCMLQWNNQDLCDMVQAHVEQQMAKAGESAAQALVWVQIALTVCGFVPAFGEACDALDAIIAYAQGDKFGMMTSLAAMIPFAGVGAGGKRGSDLLRELNRLRKKACGRNSFVPGTRVLLADRTTKPIERIVVGDNVLASDPTANSAVGRRVTALMRSVGEKNLVTITVDVDGENGDATASIVSTDRHPFWVPEISRWKSAGALTVNQSLLTADGHTVRVVAIKEQKRNARVHNFTVAEIHTYFVLVGNSPVLVHNSCETFENQMPGSLAAELAAAERLGAKVSTPGSPDFDAAIEDGTIKWAILEDGRLVIQPKFVDGHEISHSVLSGGGPVRAAGEAEVAGSRSHGYFGLDINNHSGHFRPSTESLQAGRDAFAAAGVHF